MEVAWLKHVEDDVSKKGGRHEEKKRQNEENHNITPFLPFEDPRLDDACDGLLFPIGGFLHRFESSLYLFFSFVQVGLYSFCPCRCYVVVIAYLLLRPLAYGACFEGSHRGITIIMFMSNLVASWAH